MGGEPTLVNGEVEIIEYVNGVEVVLDPVLEPASLFLALGINSVERGGEHCGHCPDNNGKAANGSARGCAKRDMARPLYGRYYEQRKIEHEDSRDRRHEVVEQFHGLAGVGRDEVEKHVCRYHAATVEIDKHHWKAAKNTNGKRIHTCLPGRRESDMTMAYADKGRTMFAIAATMGMWSVIDNAMFGTASAMTA